MDASKANPFSVGLASPSPTQKMKSNTEKLRHFKMSTPPWRETFRMRCSERAKDNRSKLVDRFRGNVLSNHTLIRQEFESFTKEQGGELCLQGQETDDLLKYFEQLEEQLNLEEQQCMLASDELYLSCELDSVNADQATADCPNCLTVPLQLHYDNGHTYCTCHKCALQAKIPDVCVNEPQILLDHISAVHQAHACPGLKFVGDPANQYTFIAYCDTCKFSCTVFDA